MAVTVSPIRLMPEVQRALRKYHGQALRAHGLSYAVNVALASAFGVKPPLTPPERMSAASKKRWRSQKAATRAKSAKRAAKKAPKE